jgi:hypothetical protein
VKCRCLCLFIVYGAFLDNRFVSFILLLHSAWCFLNKIYKQLEIIPGIIQLIPVLFKF